jgi:hypothetical protein
MGRSRDPQPVAASHHAGPEATGLAEPEVFYFGNAVAESGNTPEDAKVNVSDMLLARNNPRTFLNPAEIDFAYDYNRDGRVNATDMLLARNNPTNFLTALPLLTAPGTGEEAHLPVSRKPASDQSQRTLALPPATADTAETRLACAAEGTATAWTTGPVSDRPRPNKASWLWQVGPMDLDQDTSTAIPSRRSQSHTSRAIHPLATDFDR